MGRSQSFDEYLKRGARSCAAVYDTEPEARQIIDVARGLEGIVRNSSIHAAAVVIADRPLTDIVPLQLAEDRGAVDEDGERSYRTVTQYSMKPIEEIGLLKMDFLGLRNLDVIEAALDIIEQSTGERPGHGRRSRSTTRRPTRCSRAATRSACSSSSPTACARRCKKVTPDRVQRPRRARRALPAGRDALHRHLRAQQAQPRTRSQYLDERLRPITESTLRGDPLPGAVDADRQGDRRLLRPRGGRPAQGDRQEAARPHGGAQGPLLRGRPRDRHHRGRDPASCGRSTRRPPTTRSTAPTPPATR